MNTYFDVVRRFSDFHSRADRAEFWIFTAINVLAPVGIALVEAMFGSPGVLAALYALVMLVPSLAVAVRRLHDLDRSGWWLLIWLVPFVGWIIVLVFMVLEGSSGENRYGPPVVSVVAA